MTFRHRRPCTAGGPDVAEAMNNFSALFRSLIVYAVCVVLAICLGYLLTGPLTYSSLFLYGGLFFLLVSPSCSAGISR